jgi:hypothetical protein
VTVTHVLAQTDVGNCDKLGTFFFDRTERLLHDTIFSISAARLLVFFPRNSENKHGLQSELLRALRFIDNFANGKLKDARHARDRPPLFDLLTDKQRQNEIVRRQIRFAHKIPQRSGMPQAPGPMDQISHKSRLRMGGSRRKLAMGRVRPTGGLDGAPRSR